MITLHSVTKVVGRGRSGRTLLDGIDWTLPPRTQYAILGQTGAGKTTLLQILGGTQFPTRGWVERRAIVSSPVGLLRFATALATPRQLIQRLAKVYEVDDQQLFRFVEDFSELEGAMDTTIRKFTKDETRRLGAGLFYGIPCDYYLFDGRFGSRSAHIKSKVLDAHLQRRKQAGMVLATGNTREALAFGGIGGILFRGKLKFFASVEEAVAIFERLKIENPNVSTKDRTRETPDEDEDDYF